MGIGHWSSEEFAKQNRLARSIVSAVWAANDRKDQAYSDPLVLGLMDDVSDIADGRQFMEMMAMQAVVARQEASKQLEAWGHDPVTWFGIRSVVSFKREGIAALNEALFGALELYEEEDLATRDDDALSGFLTTLVEQFGTHAVIAFAQLTLWPMVRVESVSDHAVTVDELLEDWALREEHMIERLPPDLEQ